MRYIAVAWIGILVGLFLGLWLSPRLKGDDTYMDQILQCLGNMWFEERTKRLDLERHLSKDKDERGDEDEEGHNKEINLN